MTTSPLDQAPGALACVVEVAGRTFAVEITQAREARVLTEYTIVPLSPLHLIGMTNVRGAIVPIVDLGVLLGLPPHRGLINALVVESNTVRVALAVDHVLGVERLEPALGAAESATESPRFERGHVRRGNDDVPILDVVKIVESLV